MFRSTLESFRTVVHLSLPIIDAKGWLIARKDALGKEHPDWSEAQISTIAEWEYYFSQWKVRFLKNIPFAVVASVGTLTLFKDVVWFEPTLATLLSKWSEVAVQLFKVATLGLFERLGIEVPVWAVNYLMTGVGMAGIMASMISDVQIIKKTSALDDLMDHLVLSSGCFGCGIWAIFGPLIAPLWPALLLVPLTTVFSTSLARSWGISRSQLAVIQVKRAGIYLEPFVVAFAVWSGFALLAAFGLGAGHG